MDDPSTPCEALPLLGQILRQRSTGILWLGPEDGGLRIAVDGGQVVGLRPFSRDAGSDMTRLEPGGSVRLKLEQVLSQVGLLRSASGPSAAPREAEPLREQLLDLLSGPGSARFEETPSVQYDLDPSVGGTESIILEGLARIQEGEALDDILGDLDRPLDVSPIVGEERTFTDTERVVLDQVDGVATAREALSRADVDETEGRRALAGLVLTALVLYRPVPEVSPVLENLAPEDPVAERLGGPDLSLGTHVAPADETPKAEAPTAEGPRGRARPSEGSEAEAPAADKREVESSPGEGPAAEARRRELLELHERLPSLDHFEVLGLERGCTSEDVKGAHSALVKRYHPDARRDDVSPDLLPVLEAILIRTGEAWQVLSDAGSRAAYERHLDGEVRDRRPAESRAPRDRYAEETPRPPTRIASEETLTEAQRLLETRRYWDAIQILESTLPQLGPRWQRHRARILLAQAYAHNPRWVRRAEEELQELVREAPESAEAHYELGLLYKRGGLATRARAMFRKAVELKPDHRRAAAELEPGTGLTRYGFLRRLFKGRRQRP